MAGNLPGSAVYLDTSGVLAYLDADDACHEEARRAWNGVIDAGAALLMTDYVRIESWSLVQRRLGLEAVRDFFDVILPRCGIDSVGETRFEMLARQILLSNRRNLSLVDLSSFDSMQRNGIQRALAFDEHFNDHGFITPESSSWYVDS